MTEPEAILVEIDKGISMGHAGDRYGARIHFSRLWDEIGADGDSYHRCALAHSMADVQDDPQDELSWDLIALEAANLITDQRSEQAGSGPIAGFFPSLHLNLGEAYRKVGNLQSAQEHLQLGRASLGALPKSDYSTMILDGFNRLEARIEETRQS